MGFHAVHVLLSEEVGLEAQGLISSCSRLFASVSLQRPKGSSSGDDALFAFQMHLQGDHGSDGPGETKLNTAVDHWRLVERNFTYCTCSFSQLLFAEQLQSRCPRTLLAAGSTNF